MGIIVQKFGGSSLRNTKEIFNICKYITKEYDNGNSIIVVVSAQGETTDNLIKEAKEIDNNLENKRELDVLLSIGEQITSSKLSMCLKKIGYKAISLMGWQIPIKTDEIYGNANISKINLDRMMKELNMKKIVIVSGFQGINENNNDITTLGRGRI